jgi:hypothetical protein
MEILETIIACVLVFVAQYFVLPLVVGFPLIPITGLPGRLVVKTIPSDADMEAFAAEHPWRIHLAALLFRWGMVASAVIEWLLFLALIYYVSEHVAGPNWQWVYIVSLLVFLSALNNARTLQSQYTSLSERLKGHSSEVRYSHGRRDFPPDEILPPITPVRHGF